MSLYSLVAGKSRKAIENYLGQDEKRRRESIIFYQEACLALEKARGVTRAASRLMNQGFCFDYGEFSTFFKVGCIAAGKEVMTPSQYIKSKGIQRFHNVI